MAPTSCTRYWRSARFLVKLYFLSCKPVNNNSFFIRNIQMFTFASSVSKMILSSCHVCYRGSSGGSRWLSSTRREASSTGRTFVSWSWVSSLPSVVLPLYRRQRKEKMQGVAACLLPHSHSGVSGIPWQCDTTPFIVSKEAQFLRQHWFLSPDFNLSCQFRLNLPLCLSLLYCSCGWWVN